MTGPKKKVKIIILKHIFFCLNHPFPFYIISEATTILLLSPGKFQGVEGSEVGNRAVQRQAPKSAK